MTRVRPWVAAVIVAATCLAAPALRAQDAGAPGVALLGVAGTRVVLSIDGGAPRTVAVGQTVDGVRVVSVDPDGAVVEVAGKRRRLALGGAGVAVGGDAAASGGGSRAAGADASGDPSAVSRLPRDDGKSASGVGRATLVADPRGHFIVQGRINGVGTPMMVDTGASFVTMSSADARRLGIDYTKGAAGAASTANGVVRIWRVSLASVTVGGITLYGVDGAVQDAALPIVLLGNSFLGRVSLQRDGDRMALVQRY